MKLDFTIKDWLHSKMTIYFSKSLFSFKRAYYRG